MNSVPGNLEGVELISIEEPSLEPVDVSDISPEWFTGFTDAEGCFFINIRLNVAREKYIVGVVFGLVQHSRDTLLFQTLKEYFGYGRFVKENNNDVVILRVERFSDIYDKLIPFFTKYPLESSKRLDYLDFNKGCDIINRKGHLTEEGLQTLKAIKSRMNTKRKFES